MALVTKDFSAGQQSASRQVPTPDDIPRGCTDIECTAGIVFWDIPPPGSGGLARPVNYTLFFGGVAWIDVITHDGPVEKVYVPLQWAIDSVCSSRAGTQAYSSHRKTGNHRAADRDTTVDTFGMAFHV